MARGGLFAIVGFSCAGLACTEVATTPPVVPRPLPVATTPTAQVAANVPPELPPEEVPLTPVPPPDAGLTRMPAPPFVYTLVAPAPVQSSGRTMTLVRLQATGNAITDVQTWFQQNRLELPSVRARLPPDIPATVGRATLAEALTQPDGHMLLLYRLDGLTRMVAIVDAKLRLEGLFDFELYAAAPQVLPGDERFVGQNVAWAMVDNGVLYVSHHHNTYAKSSGGMNGYISAIDVAKGKLLWRSASLVSNSVNFVIADGHLITGYGFTAEPDFIYMLDQATGRVETKLPVNSQAEYFVVRGDKLYVRTYDTNYVYELRFKDK